jgi:hypothetical protein
MRFRRYLFSFVNQRYRRRAHGSRPTTIGTRGSEVLEMRMLRLRANKLRGKGLGYDIAG